MRIFELRDRDRRYPIPFAFLAALFVALLFATGLSSAAFATPPPSGSQSPSHRSEAVCTGDPLPADLVRCAAQNELRPLATPYPIRFTLRKQDEKGITTKQIVETKDGDVARLVARNDKPLSADDEKAELDRLNNLLAHPEIQEHRHKREQEDSGREDEMTRLLPDAFLYSDIGTTSGPNGPVRRLSFKPNPDFKPPDREAEVYHGMEGELWIDRTQQRIVKLDAHLIDDVEFGWGILGKLYKGGSLLIEQQDVGHHHWEPTLMKLNLTGIALMVKALSFQTTETSTDFQPVQLNMGYQDAIHLLLQPDAAPQVPQSTQGTKK